MYKTSKSMIQLETELFNYINEIRTHPETFAKSLIKEDNNPNIKNFLQSLSRFCIGKIPLLKKEPLLQKYTKHVSSVKKRNYSVGIDRQLCCR